VSIFYNHNRVLLHYAFTMVVPPSAPNTCVEIGPECTVEGTLYGYYPSLGANAFFAATFALCFIIQFIFGIKYKTWTYMVSCDF